MSGLNHLLDQIKTAAKTASDSKLTAAQQQAEDLIGEAEENARIERENILREAEGKALSIEERASSAAALQKRRAILAAKQQLIEGVIGKAKETLERMDSDEYFTVILKMVSKYALPEKGQIVFSEQDQKRLPDHFEQQINEVLSNGGSLTISSENRPLDGGFVLVYGNVEENCSFQSIFESNRDILQDKVQAFLFS